MGLTNDLRYKIAVYSKRPFVNTLGEDDVRYEQTGAVYAGIRVTRGRENSAPGETVFAEITHVVTIRRDAIPDLTNDMYFVFRGQRYDVKYFYPHFKYRDRVEIYCTLRVDA